MEQTRRTRPDIEITIEHDPSTNHDTPPPEAMGPFEALNHELGAVKKQILQLRCKQFQKDYFISLIAGVEQISNLGDSDPATADDLAYAQKSLAHISESVGVFKTEIEWYEKRNISALDNKTLETNVRSEIIDLLQKQFNLVEALLNKLNQPEAKNPSLFHIYKLIRPRFEHLAQNLAILPDIHFSDAFAKKVKVVEAHLTDINHDIAGQLQVERSRHSP